MFVQCWILQYRLVLLTGVQYCLVLLTGVIPASQDSQDFVMKNRREQFEHLQHALEVMRKTDKNTPEAEVFLKMYLIEEGLLPFQDDKLVGYHMDQFNNIRLFSVCWFPQAFIGIYVHVFRNIVMQHCNSFCLIVKAVYITMGQYVPVSICTYSRFVNNPII